MLSDIHVLETGQLMKSLILATEVEEPMFGSQSWTQHGYNENSIMVSRLLDFQNVHHLEKVLIFFFKMTLVCSIMGLNKSTCTLPSCLQSRCSILSPLLILEIQ